MSTEADSVVAKEVAAVYFLFEGGFRLKSRDRANEKMEKSDAALVIPLRNDCAQTPLSLCRSQIPGIRHRGDYRVNSWRIPTGLAQLKKCDHRFCAFCSLWIPTHPQTKKN